MSKGMLEINLPPPHTVTEMKNISDRLISKADTSKESLGELEYRSIHITQMETKEKLLKAFLKKQSTQKILAQFSSVQSLSRVQLFVSP